MKISKFLEAVAFSCGAICLGTSTGIAAGANAHCEQLGGSVLTNFLDKSQCSSLSIGLCTAGTSFGDIRGGVGVQILGINGNVYHVHHFWVTDSGDMINVKDAYLTTYPTADPNRALADYLDGVDILGGTGRFDGATGTIYAFGAVDLNLGQITLRYSGTVCFRHPAG